MHEPQFQFCAHPILVTQLRPLTGSDTFRQAMAIVNAHTDSNRTAFERFLRHPMFERLFCDDAALTRHEAVELFRAVYEHRPDIDLRLVKYAQAAEDPSVVRRVLKVISSASDARRLVMGLLRFLRSDDPAIRAQAALLVARGSRNRWFMADLLNNPDPRFRANVVEGFAGWIPDVELIRHACADDHHRVACNGAVALGQRDRAEAERILRILARRDDWRFRAAVAWAVSALKDPSLNALANRLRSDDHPNVRWNALRALIALRHAAEPSAAAFRPG